MEKQVKKQTKQQPQTLNEARTQFGGKLLLNVNKLTDSCKDAHVQLVLLLFKNVLKCQESNQINLLSEFSMLKDYCSNTGMNIYYDNDNMKTFIKSVLGESSESSLKLYLKLLYGIVELINMNILNYVVYIDCTKFGKNKLFSIIESVMFTQLLPTEVNKYEQEFKQQLKQEVKLLKSTLVSNKSPKSGDQLVDSEDQTTTTVCE